MYIFFTYSIWLVAVMEGESGLEMTHSIPLRVTQGQTHTNTHKHTRLLKSVRQYVCVRECMCVCVFTCTPVCVCVKVQYVNKKKREHCECLLVHAVNPAVNTNPEESERRDWEDPSGHWNSPIQTSHHSHLFSNYKQKLKSCSLIKQRYDAVLFHL
jgi:hypothetical protein